MVYLEQLVGTQGIIIVISFGLKITELKFRQFSDLASAHTLNTAKLEAQELTQWIFLVAAHYQDVYLSPCVE